MKIIGRYVLKEHVGPFLFASTALTSLMLLQYIAKRFGDLVGKGLPTSVIAEFMALSIPFTVAMTMPMAVLVAVLYAFSRLAAENEINALKASGVGMRAVLTPVLFGGFGMMLVMIAFNDQVLPRANHRLAVLQLDIFRTKPTFALREQVINTVKEGQLYLKAGSIDEATSDMTDIVIYDLSDALRRRTIYAESGKLALAPNRRDLDLTLYNGVMIEVPNKDPGELTRLFYTWDRLRVENVYSSYEQTETGAISKGDREMSVCEMQQRLLRSDFLMRRAQFEARLAEWERTSVGTPPRMPDRAQAPPGIGTAYCALLALITNTPAPTLSVSADTTHTGNPLLARVPSAGMNHPGRRSPDGVARADTGLRLPDESGIKSRIEEARYRETDARRERDRYDVEIQKKFSLAAACIIFVLIGAPLALRYPRGGVGLVIGVSFAIFGLYYVGLIGGETLADKGYLPPWLAMWGTNIALALSGLVLAARMGRESSTSRGGDFSELLVTIRARLFGWLRRLGVPVDRRRK